MCGIVGYIGRREAQPILFRCLERLEYRGYDSSGIAIVGSKLTVFKDKVRVGELSRMSPPASGTLGIGHTRWATHGKPSRANSHPHCDCSGGIAIVHNGIITNYQHLKESLIREGHRFASETDSEVIAHLVEKYYQGDIESAATEAIRQLEGSYALIVISDAENKLFLAKRESPLVVGLGDRENFVASDVPAVLDFTKRVIFLDDGDTGTVTADGVKIVRDGRIVVAREEEILWNPQQAQKGGYEHFMLKEIHEQPKVIRDTLAEYTHGASPIIDLERIRDSNIESMLMLACGTSYYASLVGKYLFEELVGIPVRAELASEFNYYNRVLAKTLALVITQSGETADAVKAIRRLRDAGCHVLVITNVVGSSASRAADQTIYTRAGPEMSVAATKSFTGQLMVLYWLALAYARSDARRIADIILGLRSLPSKVQEVLDNSEAIMDCARYLSDFNSVFFVGRGINYPIALEGALKLKEISYIHAEGCAAGELKHGPFAMLGEETPVVAIATGGDAGTAMATSIKEIKARGSPLIILADGSDETIGELADYLITVPQTDKIFSPVVNVVALQLLAYHAARCRGCPIDFPRNLAKSVTVE